MSNPILSLYNLERDTSEQSELPFTTGASRSQNIEALSTNRNVDLLIIGGGLTGALVAWRAALQDIRVVLVDRGICGAHALSWKPRIAQLLRTKPLRVLGGGRILRRMRASLAPHLVSEAPLDAQSPQGSMLWLARKLIPDLDVDERLLIREIILAARQEGAMVFQAADPLFVEAESDSGCYIVGVRDHVSEQQIDLRVGGIVIDPSCGFLPPTRLGTSVLNLRERVPAGVQRVYTTVPRTPTSGFRFASFELTEGSFVSIQRVADGLVEATVLFGDRELSPVVLDTVLPDAVREAGWHIQSEVSSREIDGHFRERYEVLQQRGIFTCSHRTPWDPFLSSEKIVKELVSCTSESRSFKTSSRRPLPGEERGCEIDAFRAQARAHGVPERTIELCIKRWRGRVRYIPHLPRGLTELCPGVLSGEVDLAYRSDHATSVEDIVFGALALYQVSGWQELIPSISDRFRQIAG